LRGLSLSPASRFSFNIAEQGGLVALWDRVKTELDRAGRAAQHAIDEGRIRLEMLRARRQADSAAQKLGYAVYRARKENRELASE